jgi:hypothetical protein
MKNRFPRPPVVTCDVSNTIPFFNTAPHVKHEIDLTPKNIQDVNRENFEIYPLAIAPTTEVPPNILPRG